MPPSGTPQSFHVIRMVAAADASAFIAALSRLVASPRGSAFRGLEPAPEVWARPGERKSVEVYLNATAQEAALTAFAPMPAGDVVAELPNDAVRVFANISSAMSSDQVRRLLDTG